MNNLKEIISHVHWAYNYLGPFGVLWVHMAGLHAPTVRGSDSEPTGIENAQRYNTTFYAFLLLDGSGSLGKCESYFGNRAS